MLDVISYIVYFLGPFLLAFFIGKRLLKAKYSIFTIGLFAFLIAWGCVATIQGIAGEVSDSIKPGTIWSSLIIAASAGLFEESARFFAFRILKKLREKMSWNTGIMYAIGHSGMESIIVGGTIILTILLVKYAPENLTPELLEEFAVLEIGFWQGLYNSFERLFVGLLVHACFTCVVLLSIIKSQKKYLLLAMLWHFCHDMIAFSILYRLSDYWIAGKLWIVFIVVVYSWILFKLRKTIAKENT